ncbi:angiotensin-converting enzyme-like protein Ace3 isoform X2 [Amblyomma americanum]
MTITMLCVIIFGALVSSIEGTSEHTAGVEKPSATSSDHAVASKFLKAADQTLQELGDAVERARWHYHTNMTKENAETLNRAKSVASEKSDVIATAARRYSCDSIENDQMVRALARISKVGLSNLCLEDYNQAKDYLKNMTKMLHESTVTLDGKSKLRLQPDLKRLMANSKNYSKLAQAWDAWHSTLGSKVKPLYIGFLPLAKKAAMADGFEHMSQEWFDRFGDHKFGEKVIDAWTEVYPLYVKLHAFVRKLLRGKYGSFMPTDGTIPAHLLGEMVGKDWTNVLKKVGFDEGSNSTNAATSTDSASSSSNGNIHHVPRPGGALIYHNGKHVGQSWRIPSSQDLTDNEFSEKELNSTWSFAAKFMHSLGLKPLPPSFWHNSRFTESDKGSAHCTPKLYTIRDDYRLTGCSAMTKDLFSVAKVLADVYYKRMYSQQPKVFQDGPSPGFRDGVTGFIGLATSAPKQLQNLGILPKNYVDRWRGGIFAGVIPLDEMNTRFWKYRTLYQGISPPVKRGSKDFDAGVDPNVLAHVPYLGKFVSIILTFQMFEYMCELDTQNREQDLIDCQLHGKKKIGDILKKSLKLGASKPWQDVLQILAGTSQLSGKAVRKYFRPLENWLNRQIAGETVGWKPQPVQNYIK